MTKKSKQLLDENDFIRRPSVNKEAEKTLMSSFSPHASSYVSIKNILEKFTKIFCPDY